MPTPRNDAELLSRLLDGDDTDVPSRLKPLVDGAQAVQSLSPPPAPSDAFRAALYHQLAAGPSPDRIEQPVRRRPSWLARRFVLRFATAGAAAVVAVAGVVAITQHDGSPPPTPQAVELMLGDLHDEITSTLAISDEERGLLHLQRAEARLAELQDMATAQELLLGAPGQPLAASHEINPAEVIGSLGSYDADAEAGSELIFAVDNDDTLEVLGDFAADGMEDLTALKPEMPVETHAAIDRSLARLQAIQDRVNAALGIEPEPEPEPDPAPEPEPEPDPPCEDGAYPPCPPPPAPEEPGQPENPGQPEEPGQPENPGQPEEPGQPENPGQGDNEDDDDVTDPVADPIDDAVGEDDPGPVDEITDPVDEVIDEVIEPIDDVTEPVEEAVDEVTEPLDEVTEPVSEVLGNQDAPGNSPDDGPPGPADDGPPGQADDGPPGQADDGPPGQSQKD